MIPFAKLLEESKGHWIEEARNRGVSRTHLFFVDDLPQNNRLLKETNEIIVQASLDTGACYGLSECAEIVFGKGKMLKEEWLEVLQGNMWILDPDQ